MHEAGLADIVAAQWREARRRGVTGWPRIVVRGGHHEPVDFDASLRLHLMLTAPELGAMALEIVHVPVPRLCSGCGLQFSAASSMAACPTCASPALPSPLPEDVELEWAGAADPAANIADPGQRQATTAL